MKICTHSSEILTRALYLNMNCVGRNWIIITFVKVLLKVEVSVANEDLSYAEKENPMDASFFVDFAAKNDGSLKSSSIECK